MKGISKEEKNKAIRQVEKILAYQFKDKALLETAFIHPSYANENNIQSNQRLEFLGDAVLELIVTDKLYCEFSQDAEGKLTKYRASLVSEPTLAYVVEELGLDKFILKGKGEQHNAIDSKAIKCDLFEAVVGAIYLDGGYEEAKKFVLNVLDIGIEKLKEEGIPLDAKTALQEMLKNQRIVYSTTKHGVDHNPYYKCTVIIGGENMGYGEGTNKKSAEQEAARNTIKQLKKA